MLRANILGQIDSGSFMSTPPLIFEEALAGDAVSKELLIREGKELAGYITAMARRFMMCDLDFDVVLAGGVFKGVGTLFSETIAGEIHRTAPRARIVRARFEPAVGSLLLAYDALQISVTDQMYTRLAETVPGKPFFDTASRHTARLSQRNI
jgi:hypothetical protein